MKNASINIKEARYVSRAEVNKMLYKTKQIEEIHCVDVISLYPFLCKYGKFPVRHPKEYVGTEYPPELFYSEGIIKWKFLSIRKL